MLVKKKRSAGGLDRVHRLGKSSHRKVWCGLSEPKSGGGISGTCASNSSERLVKHKLACSVYWESAALTVQKNLTETIEETTRMAPTVFLKSKRKCLCGGMGI